jgi:hypothetical protein
MSAETCQATMERAYGAPLLDWMQVVATECDASSQTAVAVKLGYSRTVVNLLVNGLYDRDLRKVEQAVRMHLMGSVIVKCPIKGEISTSVCQSNQALPYSNANSERVRLYRACRRGCIHSAIPVEIRHQPAAGEHS